MIQIDNTQALIRWEEADRIAVIEWRAFADGHEYRRLLNVLLDLIQKNSARKLLADTRQMKVIAQEDQAWVMQEWGPKAVQSGLQWTALLVPKSALAKLSLARMVGPTSSDGAGKTEYFDNVESAMSWLRAMP